MIINFYVDGGQKLGLGHIYRSINLAQVLKKKFKICFILPKSNSIKKYNLILEILTKNSFIYEFTNKKTFAEKNLKLKKSIIIFDDPKINQKKINLAKKSFDKVIIIDDENYLKFYDCDMIINQNAYANNLSYKFKNKKTKKLFGSKYTIFGNKPYENRISSIVKNILLIFGGTDPKNFYVTIPKKINDYNLIINNQNKVIKNKISSLKKKNIYLIKENNVRNIIRNNKIDLAISCCGTTLYELFANKVPTIGLLCADNQKNAFKFYSENKSLIASNFSRIRKDVQNLTYSKRINLIKSSSKFSNYNGKYEILREINKLIRK